MSFSAKVQLYSTHSSSTQCNIIAACVFRSGQNAAAAMP